MEYSDTYATVRTSCDFTVGQWSLATATIEVSRNKTKSWNRGSTIDGAKYLIFDFVVDRYEEVSTSTSNTTNVKVGRLSVTVRNHTIPLCDLLHLLARLCKWKRTNFKEECGPCRQLFKQLRL